MRMPDLDIVPLDTAEEAKEVFEDIMKYLYADEDYWINDKYSNFIDDIYLGKFTTALKAKEEYSWIEDDIGYCFSEVNMLIDKIYNTIGDLNGK